MELFVGRINQRLHGVKLMLLYKIFKISRVQADRHKYSPSGLSTFIVPYLTLLFNHPAAI
jgi:hypothetical protein